MLQDGIIKQMDYYLHRRKFVETLSHEGDQDKLLGKNTLTPGLQRSDMYMYSLNIRYLSSHKLSI